MSIRIAMIFLALACPRLLLASSSQAPTAALTQSLPTGWEYIASTKDHPLFLPEPTEVGWLKHYQQDIPTLKVHIAPESSMDAFAKRLISRRIAPKQRYVKTPEISLGPGISALAVQRTFFDQLATIQIYRVSLCEGQRVFFLTLEDVSKQVTQQKPLANHMLKTMGSQRRPASSSNQSCL